MDDLIARLRERAADPTRRTDAPRSLSLSGPGGSLTTMFGSLGGDPFAGIGGASGPGGFDGLVSDLGRVVAANQAGRPMDADIAARVDTMAASFSTDNPATAGELPPPADGPTLAQAAQHLGRPLPRELERVYAEVANGGFGPGGGLLPIERAVETYRSLVGDPPGPRSQPWPSNLLPLRDNDPGFECLDLETGRIVDWDPQELTERSGNRAWQASFREAAPSLEARLRAWVDSRPAHEALAERVEASMVEDARRSRAMIAAMTPEQRAAMGLPDVGWEKVVWGGIGLDDE